MKPKLLAVLESKSAWAEGIKTALESPKSMTSLPRLPLPGGTQSDVSIEA